MVIPAVDLAFAAGDEPGEYLDRRVVIWNLFYRLMTVGFTVGAVVAGTMIWQCWRFKKLSSHIIKRRGTFKNVA